MPRGYLFIVGRRMCDSSVKLMNELIQPSCPFLTLVLFYLAGRGGGDTEATSKPEGSAGNHRGEHRRYTPTPIMSRHAPENSPDTT